MPENTQIIQRLNKILELELAGVIRYTHYSFMIFGYNRIPIVHWLREQAAESLQHAQRAGELITHLGGYPSLNIGTLLDKHTVDIGEILKESVEHEQAGLREYKALLAEVGDSVFLEEYAREMIATEELHVAETLKMLQKPAEFANK
jgi:bacterioferritin